MIMIWSCSTQSILNLPDSQPNSYWLYKESIICSAFFNDLRVICPGETFTHALSRPQFAWFKYRCSWSMTLTLIYWSLTFFLNELKFNWSQLNSLWNQSLIINWMMFSTSKCQRRYRFLYVALIWRKHTLSNLLDELALIRVQITISRILTTRVPVFYQQDRCILTQNDIMPCVFLHIIKNVGLHRIRGHFTYFIVTWSNNQHGFPCQ